VAPKVFSESATANGPKNRQNARNLAKLRDVNCRFGPFKAESGRLRSVITSLPRSASGGRRSNARERFVKRSLEALNERPSPGKKPKVDVKAKARLIAEAFSDAPEGQIRWTMRLLADRLVE
jgi:hypothetical protein